MISERQQRTGGGAAWLMSLLLHGAVFGGAFVGGARYLALGGTHPGTAAGGAIHADLVTHVPGGAIPIPSAVTRPTKNRLANNLKGSSVSRPQRRPATREKSVALPSFNASAMARQQAAADLKKLAQADQRNSADQRVAYGAGGRVSFSATSSSESAGGGGGVSFGDANFGHLYTAWVNNLRDRLQFYWDEQPRTPNLPTGERVTVMLKVHRSGLIDSIHYVTRSNSVQLNQMAFQAVQQMAAKEHFPLPVGYGPLTLTVSVAFDLN